MGRSLLFITLHRLGDAVMTTGILHEALQRFAPDRVIIASGPSAAPLFEAVPHLESISIVDKQKPMRYWLKLWMQTAGPKWDVVIDIRNTLLSYLIPARKVHRFKRSDATKHKAEQLATLLGCSPPPPNKIWLTESAQMRAAQLMPTDGPVLALCPSATWPGKQWPAERFVELAKRMLDGFPALSGAQVAVFAAAHERWQAEPVIAGLSGQHHVIDLVGQTDALEAAACLARCALVLANDSGIMHLAAAVGAPTLGLFGPTNDVEYRPFGPRAAFVRGAAFDKAADPRALMLALSVEDVVAAAEKISCR